MRAKTDTNNKKQTLKSRVKKPIENSTKNLSKKPRKETPKGTTIEVKNRVALVAEMIIKGYNKENIVRYGSENWKITERQIEEYIKRANETFVEEAKAKDIDYHLNLALQQLQDLYKKSYAIQDYAECRRIKKDIADYLGFAAAKKVDISGTVNVISLGSGIDPTNEAT